ncbi:hypothetical protein OC844_007686 [Tilletia horrida]|nr:hypothetical protein OC844_007686 [Tilletia horrida]
MFHDLPRPSRLSRVDSSKQDALRDLVGTPRQDGMLFMACLSFFNGGLQRPSAQRQETRIANEVVERFGTELLGGRPTPILDTERPISYHMLRDEATSWHDNLINLVQQHGWQRLCGLVDGLGGVEKARKQRNDSDPSTRAHARQVIKALSAYKDLLNRRELFDPATGKDTEAFLGLAEHTVVREVDKKLRPYIRQYLPTLDELPKLPKTVKKANNLSVQQGIGRFPGHHIVLFLAVHAIRDWNAKDFPRGLQCVPIRSTMVPKFFTIDHTSLVQDVLEVPLSAVQSGTTEARLQNWDKIFRIDTGCFKPAGDKEFLHSIQTDGIALAVHKQDVDTERSGRERTRGAAGILRASKRQESVPDVPYIEDLRGDLVLEKKGRAVLDDVGEHNLHYFVHEGFQVGARSEAERGTLQHRWSYSRMERDTERGYRQHQDRRERYLDDLPQAEKTQLATFHDLVSSTDAASILLDDFTAYVDAYLSFGSFLHRIYEAPVFRHLRMESHSRDQRETKRLVRDFKARFGGDALLIMGDSSMRAVSVSVMRTFA